MNEVWNPHERRDGPLLIRADAGDGGSQVLALAGELDSENAETLAVEIARTELAAGGELTIDLRNLSFIDSTGIALLVSVFRRFNASGNRLHLVPSRSETVRRVMELTGLDRTLPFVEHREVRPRQPAERPE